MAAGCAAVGAQRERDMQLSIVRRASQELLLESNGAVALNSVTAVSTL